MFEADRVILPQQQQHQGSGSQHQQLYQQEVSSLVESMYQGVNSALLAYGKLTRMTFKTFWHNNGIAIDSMYQGIHWALLARYVVYVTTMAVVFV